MRLTARGSQPIERLLGRLHAAELRFFENEIPLTSEFANTSLPLPRANSRRCGSKIDPTTGRAMACPIRMMSMRDTQLRISDGRAPGRAGWLRSNNASPSARAARDSRPAFPRPAPSRTSTRCDPLASAASGGWHPHSPAWASATTLSQARSSVPAPRGGRSMVRFAVSHGEYSNFGSGRSPPSDTAPETWAPRRSPQSVVTRAVGQHHVPVSPPLDPPHHLAVRTNDPTRFNNCLVIQPLPSGQVSGPFSSGARDAK
jgi:hypothetical protein